MSEKTIELNEKKFNELISNATEKAMQASVDAMTKSVSEKMEKMVEEKMEKKGLNKVNRSFMNEIDKKEIDKMETKERFVKFLKAIDNNDKMQAKALSEGNDTEGGYLVPEETQSEIIRVMEDYGIIRKLAHTKKMKRETMNVPRLTSSVSVYWPGENNAGTESNPVFGNVELVARTVVGLLTESLEFFEDADKHVTDDIIDLFAEAIAGEEDNQGLNGSGAPFTGILQDGDVTVLTMDSGDTAFTDVDSDYLRTMIANVKSSLVQGSVFIMNRGLWAIVQKLKDSTSGQHLVSVISPVIKGPDATTGYGLKPAGFVWGIPVYLSDKMPATTASAVSTKFLIFGNFKKAFLLGDRKKIGIDIFKEGTIGGVSLLETNKLGIRITERIAEAISVPSAFVVLKTAAS